MQILDMFIISQLLFLKIVFSILTHLHCNDRYLKPMGLTIIIIIIIINHVFNLLSFCSPYRMSWKNASSEQILILFSFFY